MYKVLDFIEFIESFANPKYKEDWDNVGLMIGDREADVSNVILTMDLTFGALDIAKNLKNPLVIAHHPLIYYPIKNVTTDTLIGKKIIQCIKQDVSFYVAHTNFDLCTVGTSDALYDMLKLMDKKVILPFEDSEEVGLGRVGTFQEDINIGQLLDKLKGQGFHNIKYFLGNNDFNKKLKKIAICAGSFDKPTVRKAKSMGADAILSGDLKYHDAQVCFEEDLPYIDIGHYDSEMPSIYKLKDILAEKFQIDIIVSDKNEAEIKNY